MEEIRSIKDERVVAARALRSQEERKRRGRALVYGEEAIRWATESGRRVEAVFTIDAKPSSLTAPVYKVSEGIQKKITDTNYTIPLVAVVSFPQARWPVEGEVVVVLDGVRDLGNIGTIVRTAAAFGIDEIVSTNVQGDLFYRKTVDASRGSAFRMIHHSFASGGEAIGALKEAGYQIAVTTPHEAQVQSFAEVNGPLAVVLGNESDGVSNEVLELADVKIQISMIGEMESLNVGVAAGITLHEMKVKVILGMLVEKIRGSFGREISLTGQWIRQLFDTKLRETTPYTADDAITLMELKCEGRGRRNDRLLGQGLVQGADEVTLTPKGEEVLAQLWLIHEQIESAVLEGLTTEEKGELQRLLRHIQANCEGIASFRG